MNSKLGQKLWIFNELVSRSPVTKFNTAISSQFSKSIKICKDSLDAGDHLLYFNPSFNKLSPDGYFEYQTPSALLVKSIPFTRRMWAMGTMNFDRDLSINREYSCQEKIKFIRKIKDDYFVSVVREIRNLESDTTEPLIAETRTLIYTNSAISSPRLKSVDMNPTYNTAFVFKDLDVFRYCALTFNPHRIHWDHQYCTEIEGYNDIVTPGPLMLHTLLKYLKSQIGLQVKSIQYKNINCMYQGTATELCVSRKQDGVWHAQIRDANDHRLSYFEASMLIHE